VVRFRWGPGPPGPTRWLRHWSTPTPSATVHSLTMHLITTRIKHKLNNKVHALNSYLIIPNYLSCCSNAVFSARLHLTLWWHLTIVPGFCLIVLSLYLIALHCFFSMDCIFIHSALSCKCALFISIQCYRLLILTLWWPFWVLLTYDTPTFVLSFVASSKLCSVAPLWTLGLIELI